MNINSILANDGSICIFIDGKVYTVTPSHINYKIVYDMVKSNNIDIGQLKRGLGIEAITMYTNGKVHVDAEQHIVRYDGVDWPDKNLVLRILQIIRMGYNPKPIINFLDKIGQNQSFRSIMQLFDFISNYGLPICEDGDVLAYKAVNSKYLDKWTGTKYNGVGATVREDRSLICDDPDVPCARGLHAGTIEYVRSYGSGLGDKFIIVKINPKNVVCVPSKDIRKMRVCEYTVVCDHDKNTFMDGEIYDCDGNKVLPETLIELTNAGYEPRCENYDDHEYGNYEECEIRENRCLNCGQLCQDNEFCSLDCEDEYYADEYYAEDEENECLNCGADCGTDKFCCDDCDEEYNGGA